MFEVGDYVAAVAHPSAVYYDRILWGKVVDVSAGKSVLYVESLHDEAGGPLATISSTWPVSPKELTHIFQKDSFARTVRYIEDIGPAGSVVMITKVIEPGVFAVRGRLGAWVARAKDLTYDPSLG